MPDCDTECKRSKCGILIVLIVYVGNSLARLREREKKKTPTFKEEVLT
jgi:hypothetical protein